MGFCLLVAYQCFGSSIFFSGLIYKCVYCLAIGDAYQTELLVKAPGLKVLFSQIVLGDNVKQRELTCGGFARVLEE